MKKKFLSIGKPYLLIAPAMAAFLLFSIYPVMNMVQLSFFDWNMISPQKDFIGLANYQKLFYDEDFRQTLLNTAVFTVLSVLGDIGLGLLIALYLKKNTLVNRIMQSVIFAPYIISLASISLLWMWLMNPDYGLLNAALEALHIPGINWLGSPQYAMLSVILICVWKSVGYDAMILLAALQSVPENLYEAAALDRASWWRKLTKVTLPMISPTLFFLTIVETIASFNVFETIQILTRGGPQNSTDTIVFSLYQYGFKFYRIGYASTIGVVLMIIMTLFTIVYFVLLSKRVHYQ